MKTTINHDEIKSWVEEHGGKPEIVEEPEAGSDLPFLRINFPGKEDEVFLGETNKQKILSWDEFFKKFDGADLAFMYEPNPKGEDISLSYRFIKRVHEK